MARSALFVPFRHHHHRPFRPLAALAVTLLLSVSTAAHAGPAGPTGVAGAAELLRGIERDLSALRAQLELIGADEAPGPVSLREQIALSPGLGDGGRVFRLRSLETMVRSLERRVDRLVEAQYRAGNDRGLDIARLMSLDARSVRWGIEELRFAREPHLLRAARERLGRTLTEIARGATAVASTRAEMAAGPRSGPG